MHPDSNLASESNIVDVLVVGAGLSGLRAALDVQKAGLSCIVLEATDRVGGKTLTVPSKPTGPGVNDIGGAWINDTTQSEMCRLLQKYNLQGEVQRTEGMSLLQLPEGTIAHPHDELPVINSCILSDMTRSLQFFSSRKKSSCSCSRRLRRFKSSLPASIWKPWLLIPVRRNWTRLPYKNTVTRHSNPNWSLVSSIACPSLSWAWRAVSSACYALLTRADLEQGLTL